MIVTDRRNIYFFYKKSEETDEQCKKLKHLAEEHGFRVVHHHNDK